MNRNEFLIQLWKRIIMPLIMLAVIYFCLRFLISVFQEKGTARSLTFGILLLCMLFTTAYFVGSFLGKVRARNYMKLSDKAKRGLNILSNVTGYLVLLVLGAALYNFWQKDAVFASFLLILFLANILWSHIQKRTNA